MNQQQIRSLLTRVAAGETSVDDAILSFKRAPFEELGFAKPDHHRGLRQGVAEVIFGAGKTPAQIEAIASAMQSEGERCVLITRLSKEAAEALGGRCLNTAVITESRSKRHGTRTMPLSMPRCRRA